MFENGIILRETRWTLDGTVQAQARDLYGYVSVLRDGAIKTNPPWWWDAQDQTKPTAPWWDHEKNRAKE